MEKYRENDPVSLNRSAFRIFHEHFETQAAEGFFDQELMGRLVGLDNWLKRNDPTWKSPFNQDKDVVEQKGNIFQRRSS